MIKPLFTFIENWQLQKWHIHKKMTKHNKQKQNISQ